MPPSPPTFSIILPLAEPYPGLAPDLAAWQGQLDELDELIIIGQNESARELAQSLPPAPGRRILGPDGPGQPSAAQARRLGLAQARGQIVLFSLPGCRPAPELLGLLRQAFERPELAGLSGVLEPLPPQEAAPAGLAGLELCWQQQDNPWPSPACLALRREAVLEAGGLDAAWPGAGDLWDLWWRLAQAGQQLEVDPQCRARLPQPGTWGGLLARARLQGAALFSSRRLPASQGLLPDRPGLQVALLLAAWAALAGFARLDPGRGLSLAAMALLLLYPLNRAFLRFAAQEEPALLGRALLYCLLRPWAWALGLLGAALGWLGGRRGGHTING